MPKMGFNMPIMGIFEQRPGLKPAAGLADALFSSTQQRVLALLFGQPNRSFFANELIALAGAGSGAVQRELKRLAESGLLTVVRIGKQKHFQANPESPIYAELCAIASKTFGLAEPLRSALQPLADRIDGAFIFGSIAKKTDTSSSDIDLMVIGDPLSYADVFAAVEPVLARIGRPVNPTVYSRGDLARKIAEGNAFATRIMSQPKIWLIGDEESFTP
jgi:predicted nucleotidyltransferase